MEPAISTGWSGGPGSHLEKHLCEAVAGETGMPSHHAEPQGEPSLGPQDVAPAQGRPNADYQVSQCGFSGQRCCCFLQAALLWPRSRTHLNGVG